MIVFLSLVLLIALSRLCLCDVVVQTECGLVSGVEKYNAYSFRGIPYASPPIGELRWRPPEVLKPKTGNCFNGTYNATTFGNTCYQISPNDHKTLIGSEDCLYLNVITPTLDGNAQKPVMVWIPGGGLQDYNGNWPLYSPNEKLANNTDIVYVGFNYRLHAFGFMALQMLADNSSTGTSGNYGFMDMIAVLQWVHTNIQNLGGNPHQVTVFGQSSGGTAIFALLASPLCKGLFHKAWLLSASSILNKTASDAYLDNEIFLRNTNCNNTQCLYALTAKKVTLSVPWNAYPYWAMVDQQDLPIKSQFDGAIAIIDGFVIPEAPFTAWENGHIVDVPLLIGSCGNEIDFDPFNMSINTWTWQQYEDHVNKTIGTFGPDILETARKLYPSSYITPEYQLTSMASDIRMNCPNDVLSLRASSTFKSPVLRYVVTSFPSVPVNAVEILFPASYSFHMWDVFAFFGIIPDYIESPTIKDIEWQRNVQNEVISFVHKGRPSTLSWKPYPEVTASLSDVTQPTDGFHTVQCEFWLQHGFYNYAWIN